MLNTTRSSGKMTLTINHRSYLQLWAEADISPKVIESEGEYRQFLAVAESLLAKKKLRTVEETALLRMVVKLIEDYESKHYSLDDWGKSLPHEILQHIMAASGTKQVDLVGIIGSKGVVSEVVNGSRSISKSQAKKLGEMFKVSPSLFI
jgi:HTH-type transcriptional regulator / antitoxin HigA